MISFIRTASLILAMCGLSIGVARAGEDEQTFPVWLLANGFHTSMVLRTRDVPFADQICGAPLPDKLVIGWGARAFYMGPATTWAIMQAMMPLRGAIQIVPAAGSLERDFPHSDIVLLHLTRPELTKLVSLIDESFKLDAQGRRIFLQTGYSPGSRFYLSGDRFLFPYVCNMWVAVKLKRSGVPIFPPCTVVADGVIEQGARLGLYFQRRHGPKDSY